MYVQLNCQLTNGHGMMVFLQSDHANLLKWMQFLVACLLPYVSFTCLLINYCCTANSKLIQDGTYEHQTVLLDSLLARGRNNQMCKTFVHA